MPQAALINLDFLLAVSDKRTCRNTLNTVKVLETLSAQDPTVMSDV